MKTIEVKNEKIYEFDSFDKAYEYVKSIISEDTNEVADEENN